MDRLTAIIVFLAAVLGIAGSESARADGRRVALVLGNSAYKNTAVLANPANDAADIAATLRDLEFEVIEEVNVDYDRLRRAVLEFSRKMEGAEVGLLFYAGHGIQVSDQNYLVPVDARLQHARDVDLQLMQLDMILAQMERETAIRLIFLDACRDNPLAGALASATEGTYSQRRGLAQIGGGAGTYVAFATKPGDTASDGDGRNSPFTAALKTHIRNSLNSLTDIMPEIRKDVMRATESRQVPWEMSSLTGPFYFKRPQSLAAAPIVAPVPTMGNESTLSKGVEPAPAGSSVPTSSVSMASATSDGFVSAVWADVVAANKVEIFRAFVDAFPSSIYSKLAQGHIESLQRRVSGFREKAPATSKRAESRTMGASLETPIEVPEMAPESAGPPTDGEAAAGPRTFKDCPKCPEMVAVEAGRFLMGSLQSEQGRQRNEGPQREVRITRPFAVSVFEVTVREYAACVEAGKCKQSAGGARTVGSAILNELLDARRPATNVSWEDARNYALWLSAETGWQYQLLSEAEWEYSARAGSATAYSWGDVVNAGQVRCSDCADVSEDRRSVIVGQHAANGFGLHDMAGNVWEWVADCWHDSYAQAEFSHWAWLDKGGGDCTRRVLRGGSWANSSAQLRSAYRLAGAAVVRGELIGFRISRVDRQSERISRFVEQDYLGEPQTDLPGFRQLYCEKVDYFGKPATDLVAVAADKAKFYRRWPYRSYVMVPGTLEVKSGSAPSTYEIAFNYNFRVSKMSWKEAQLTPGNQLGTARLRLLESEGTFRICGEDGEVLKSAR